MAQSCTVSYYYSHVNIYCQCAHYKTKHLIVLLNYCSCEQNWVIKTNIKPLNKIKLFSSAHLRMNSLLQCRALLHTDVVVIVPCCKNAADVAV